MMSRLGRWLRWIGAGLLVVFLGLQFVPVERTNPHVMSDIKAPPEIDAILRRACYDCHSHETRWPWYSRIAPVSWWVADHVEHGRSDLNFSMWPVFDFEEQDLAMGDIEEQIRKGEMPLPSYLILHRDARLSDADRELLLRWAGR